MYQKDSYIHCKKKFLVLKHIANKVIICIIFPSNTPTPLEVFFYFVYPSLRLLFYIKIESLLFVTV